MLVVSTRTLGLLAALVWYTGAVMLLWKGGRLLVEAGELSPAGVWPGFAVAIGMCVGVMKARLVFSRTCEKNLERIAALGRPRVWQIFTPRFLVALAAMIAAGASLSRLAHGNYPLLNAVAALDVAIATALLWSSGAFWWSRTPGA